jgi:hypothetical protein
MQQQIKQISDLERLNKIAAGKVSPREVVYLKNRYYSYKNTGFRKSARRGKNYWRHLLTAVIIAKRLKLR